jgi:rod shape-determining protein MreD
MAAPGDHLIGIEAGRALALLVAGWLGLVLGAALPVIVPMGRVPAPDAVLLVVLFVGLAARGQLAGVCALAAALGYLADISAGSPKGVHMIAYGLLGVCARAASARLLVRGAFFTALVAAFFAVGFGAVVVGLRDALGAGAAWRALRDVPLAALSTAIAAPFAFAILRRVDRWFTHDPRALRMGMR